MIKVLLFAGLREAVGSEVVYPPSDYQQATVGVVKNWLVEQYPQVEELLSKCMCAVDQAYANEETIVGDSAEIAFIPPVSGG